MHVEIDSYMKYILKLKITVVFGLYKISRPSYSSLNMLVAIMSHCRYQRVVPERQ